MMKINRFILIALLTAAVTIGISGGVARAAVTSFSEDVNTSIDMGLAWMFGAGYFNNPSSATDAAGLALLCILEKRLSNDQNAEPQGYVNASAADQAGMRRVVAYILANLNTVGTYRLSYRDGSSLMALSLYLRTGGLDRGAHADLPAALPYDLIGGINKIVDRFATYQRPLGYWCYSSSFASCDDASTTQFVVAGLAAARSVYTTAPWVDLVRDSIVVGMLDTARTGYESGGTTGPGPIPTVDDGKGHGYNRGDANSQQQTGSGTWVQLAGGSDLNSPEVQNYLKWLYLRYNYQTHSGAQGGWGSSYFYYMWTSSKAYAFLEDSLVAPNVGNLSVADLGTLPGAAAPVFAGANGRLENLDPNTVTRVPLFGAEGAGYYADPSEPARWYFDYAYTVLTKQLGSGQYNGTAWNTASRQAYCLLVLERSVGGGCVDSDQDGTCDEDDPCPNDPDDLCLIDCVEDLTARPKPGEVTLVWTHVGADSYNVYRSVVAGGPYVLLSNTASVFSTYLDTTVVNGTPYYYVVKPLLGAVEHCPETGNEASATPVAGRRRR